MNVMIRFQIKSSVNINKEKVISNEKEFKMPLKLGKLSIKKMVKQQHS